MIVKQKFMSPIFLNSGTLVILCLFETMGSQFYSFLTIFKVFNICICIQLSCHVETEVWLLTIFFTDFKRAGHKVEGKTLYIPIRHFIVPLFWNPWEKCGRLWKAAWLYKVHNIQQKDIHILMLKDSETPCPSKCSTFNTAQHIFS